MTSFFLDSTNVGSETFEKSSCCSVETIVASNLSPSTLVDEFGEFVQRWLSNEQRAARVDILRNIQILRPSGQEDRVTLVLKEISEAIDLEGEGRESFNDVRARLESLELSERILVLNKALAPPNESPGGDSPPVPARIANEGAVLSSLSSSPHRHRHRERAEDENQDVLSSVSFGGSHYSLYFEILKPLDYVVNQCLDDSFCAEEIRLLRLAAWNREPGEDLPGDSDEAADFYAGFRQRLQVQLDNPELNLGSKLLSLQMALHGLDMLEDTANRFAHVRQVLMRIDDQETVHSRPNYPTGTVVGSTHD